MSDWKCYGKKEHERERESIVVEEQKKIVFWSSAFEVSITDKGMFEEITEEREEVCQTAMMCILRGGDGGRCFRENSKCKVSEAKMSFDTLKS